MKHIITYILIFILFQSCQTSSKLNSKNSIKSSCDLINHTNDTVIIDGIYTSCMEYSFFRTFKTNKCSDKLRMELNLSEVQIDKKVLTEISTMIYCNASKRMLLKGVLRNNKPGYGHLNTNNYEFIVVEIIKLYVINDIPTKKKPLNIRPTAFIYNPINSF